jgi:predicted AAA+ superfamily ATPase
MRYASRIIDGQIGEYLNGLAAIALVGAKGVGKTSTAKQFAKTVLELDVSEPARILASSKESLGAIVKKPILIDEWSRAPQSWDVVRRLVDDDTSPGQFIFTGSASQSGLNIHSGSGRIVQLAMRPLSMHERGLMKAKVSLSDILEGRVDGQIYEPCPLTLGDYAEEICLSGFPGIHNLSLTMAGIQLDGYIDNIIQKEIPEQGVKVRKPQVLRAWLKAYAAATASTASYKKILVAATPGEDQKPAASTTLVYRDLLDALYLTDRVDPWLPTDNQFSALGKTPKHYLVDTGLAARLVDVDPDGLIRGTRKPLGSQKEGSMFGRLFEGLVANSLKVYCQSCDAHLYHLRTPSGDHEVDFVITKDDVVLAVEVKLSHETSNRDTVHLHWLGTKLDEEKKCVKAIINTGTHAYRREDGVYVIPFGLLRP